MAVTDERRQELRRKFLKLGSGELVAAAIFTVVAFRSQLAPLRDAGSQAALWSALAPLLVILVQAGVYWLLARTWVGRRPMPVGLAGLYRSFRVVDPILLLAGLVGVITWMPDQPLATAVVLAVWLLALIEYVNYFVVRLAYPPSQWLAKIGQWRTPRLVLDMTHRSSVQGDLF